MLARQIPRRPGRPTRSAERGLLVCGLIVAGALILWAGRGVTFLGDEWAWIFRGLHPSAGSFLDDYNGHLLALPLGGYYALLRTVGLSTYVPYRVVAVVLQLTVAGLIFVIARRRLEPLYALLAAALVAFLGTGSDAFLSAINIGLVSATAASLAALVMLDRRTPRGDAAACGLMLCGLASFTSALAFAAGVLVEILLEPGRRRRLWVPLVPMAVYFAWRIGWATQFTAARPRGHPAAGALAPPSAAFEAATGAASGLAGIQLASPGLTRHFPWLASAMEVAVAVAGVALAWFVLRRRHAIGARFVNVVVTAIALWLLIGYGRADFGDLFASRYVYAGAVVVVLILVELVNAIDTVPRLLTRVLVAAVAASVALNIVWMSRWGNHLRDLSVTARASLTSLQISRAAVSPDFQPTTAFSLVDVRARLYFDAVRRFGGSPAFSSSDLRRIDERPREAADQILVRALGVRLRIATAAPTGPAPSIESTVSAGVIERGSCVELVPKRRPAMLAVLPRGSPPTLLLEPAARHGLLIIARRFARAYTAPIGAVRGRARILTLPLGSVSDPWHVEAISDGRARVCTARPTSPAR
jgi:hypothetical protein